MSNPCIFNGDRNVCPICSVCLYPDLQEINENGICITCYNSCDISCCPRYLDHQDIKNYNNSLSEYISRRPLTKYCPGCADKCMGCKHIVPQPHSLNREKPDQHYTQNEQYPIPKKIPPWATELIDYLESRGANVIYRRDKENQK